jgi:cytosine/adenosine deaminase-related metal-dependent hydrolase
VLFVMAAEARAVEFALRGRILTPDGVIPDGHILVRNGRIVSVNPWSRASAGPRAIKIEGVISPGLIDLHNHLTWNAMPKWRSGRIWRNRYDWQLDADYLRSVSEARTAIKSTSAMITASLEVWDEVKALAHGATSVIGGSGDRHGDCGLARNLDLPPDFAHGEIGRSATMFNAVFPLDRNAGQVISTAYGGGVLHVAEGRRDDGASRREWSILVAHGRTRTGTSVIHGIAMSANDWIAAAKAGMGLVWSPRSNLALYGQTANLAAAVSAGVTISIAPDWSVSGSDGMVDELRFVLEARPGGAELTPKEVWRMATANPARLAGLYPSLGAISAGSVADLLVVDDPGGDPHRAVAAARPSNVRLVIVNGEPVYGERRWLVAADPSGTYCDLQLTRTPCAPLTRSVRVPRDATSSGTRWWDVQAEIVQQAFRSSTVISEHARMPSPLTSCEDVSTVTTILP